MASDETSSSSRASTSILSPESVSSRAPGYEDDKGVPTKQKSRSRGSGEVGGGGSHGRGSSSESTASSVAQLAVEDLSHPVGAAVPKMGDAVNMPVRARPPVHATSRPTS